MDFLEDLFDFDRGKRRRYDDEYHHDRHHRRDRDDEPRWGDSDPRWQGPACQAMPMGYAAGRPCARCGQVPLRPDRFCSGCGAPMVQPMAMTRRCTYCNCAVAPDSRGCPSCGGPV